MARPKKVPITGEVQAHAPEREPVVEPAHEEIVAGVPEIPLADAPPAEVPVVPSPDALPASAVAMVSVPKQEFAALMYAMVTGFVNGWVRQAAVTKIGTMLGGRTHQERMVIWEDMKHTHLSKEGNQ